MVQAAYMKYKQIHSIIFDLDGTLIDSRQDIISCLGQAYSTIGYVPPEAIESIQIGPPIVEMIRMISPSLGEDQQVSIVNQFRQLYDQHDHPETSLYEGVRLLISNLSSAGINLYIATNKPQFVTRVIIERLFGTSNPFSDMVCIDSIPGRKMSKTEMLRMLATKWALNPGMTIMVGDSSHDIVAAHNNGFLSVGVLGGYGNPDDVKRAEATYLVESVVQLETVFNVD